ncbi:MULTISPECIES: orotidine 5'-phosphate decarboxylase / HUMPS family protein [Acidianus]|uniref:Orotidine 5'-phosphate decarboxylase n=1 Tax=Candidatus Acidianus copahuensis TaxID=1160895 RepID=A0A031LLA8_9CREN|nr:MULTISPECIES: orotidine 5'-phosphate decarboxylase / HUMPS family protein [Acidianus]EZQ04832.1 orotidine 5'-phosphate decarboxylase [Candidatus Acidianus copahuensis]NON62788.1 orotidine 5'-phosphate decarboxylase [Acidianus sp. RZ1]
MNRIILALDEVIQRDKIMQIQEYIYAVKIGYPLLLQLGVGGVNELLSGVKVKRILDLKLADIGNTMIKIVSKIPGDGVIAHAFIGVEGALDELKRFLDSTGEKLYLLLSMSHIGWNDSFYDYLKDVANEIKPYGIVAPATRSGILQKIRHDFPSLEIISPGVGVQGSLPGDALCNGADYEIIGRSIYSSLDPIGKVKEISKLQEERILECKGAKGR